MYDYSFFVVCIPPGQTSGYKQNGSSTWWLQMATWIPLRGAPLAFVTYCCWHECLKGLCGCVGIWVNILTISSSWSSSRNEMKSLLSVEWNFKLTFAFQAKNVASNWELLYIHIGALHFHAAHFCSQHMLQILDCDHQGKLNVLSWAVNLIQLKNTQLRAHFCHSPLLIGTYFFHNPGRVELHRESTSSC